MLYVVKIHSSDLQIEEQDNYKYKFSVTSSGHAQNLPFVIFIVVLALQSEGCQQLMNLVQHLKITRMHNAHGQVRVSIHNNNFIMNLTKMIVASGGYHQKLHFFRKLKKPMTNGHSHI